MNYLFTFINTHSAIRASEAFESSIPVHVMPLPGQLGDACGICLRVSADDLKTAQQILEDEAIENAGIYLIEEQEGKKVYLKCC